MSAFEDPWRNAGYVPYVTRDMHRNGVTGGSGLAPQWSPPFRAYVYRGTGRDELTAFMDGKPEAAAPLSRHQERLQAIAGMPINMTPRKCPPGFMTARQAAEVLGVTMRTVERLKRELAGRSS